MFFSCLGSLTPMKTLPVVLDYVLAFIAVGILAGLNQDEKTLTFDEKKRRPAVHFPLGLFAERKKKVRQQRRPPPFSNKKKRLETGGCIGIQRLRFCMVEELELSRVFPLLKQEHEEGHKPSEKSPSPYLGKGRY